MSVQTLDRLAEWTRENRSGRYIRVIARLKLGVTLDVARARMVDLSRRLGRIYLEDAGWETETHRLPAVSGVHYGL
jgi:hypothetical protein